MDEVTFRRECRRERQFERLTTRTPRCPCCGESHPASFDAHHIAGRKRDPVTVLVCATDHRKLTDMQKDHLVFEAQADPFLQTLAHFLLGLADLLELAIQKLREFAAGLSIRAGNNAACVEVKP